MNEIVEQLLGYLHGVWRNRWYVLGCAWLVCLIGWVVVHKLPDQYQATARVFVDTQSVLRPLLQGLAVNVNPDAQIGLVTRTLLSRPNLEKIARRADLDIRAKTPEAMDALLNGLQKQIGLGAAGRENLYSVAYQASDPQLAKKWCRRLWRCSRKICWATPVRIRTPPSVFWTSKSPNTKAGWPRPKTG